jgi:hypothetical protein
LARSGSAEGKKNEKGQNACSHRLSSVICSSSHERRRNEERSRFTYPAQTLAMVSLASFVPMLGCEKTC